MKTIPTIAIVGRPNVGKSTLFNRLIGKRQSITAEEAGTTRDRIFETWDCNGYQTTLVDTGGLEYGDKDNIEADIQSQAKLAIQDADLIIFVIDASQELTVDDFAATEILRKTSKPVLLAANKCDSKSAESGIFNIYELGFDEAIKISAIHNIGIDELEKNIEKTLKELKFTKTSKTPAPATNNICILGKPNAGKSSLVNALTGSEKVIVSDIPGTTRDVTDTELKYKEQTYILTDTAGLRRRGKIARGIEKFSSLRAINAIKRSEIVILLIDGKLGVTSQDTHIAQIALEEEKGLILAINKIDLLESGEEERARVVRQLRRRFPFIPWAPVVFISAKNAKNIFQLLELSDEIIKERQKRIPTPELNAFFQKITHKHLPASAKIRKPKFFYGSQVDTRPPKFLLFFKNPQNLHFSYPRYLENQIREQYGFNGTAINIKFKSKVGEEKGSK